MASLAPGEKRKQISLSPSSTKSGGMREMHCYLERGMSFFGKEEGRITMKCYDFFSFFVPFERLESDVKA